MTLRNAIILLVLLGLFACEKDIEIDLNAQSDKLVMYTFIYPDSSFNFHFSKSQSILSIEDYDKVDKGRFQLFINDNFQGAYILPSDTVWSRWTEFSFKPGDAFQINAYELNGDTVRAESFIPQAVEIESMDTATVLQDISDNNSVQMLRAKVKFQDPPHEMNFYQLLLIREGWGYKGAQPYYTRKVIDYEKTDAVFTQGDQSGSLLPGLDFRGLFVDGFINGTEYELTVLIPRDNLYFDYYEDKVRITVYLYHHTEDYYQYFRSVILADGYEGFYDGLPVFEPVKIHTNVEKGLGLVSGMNFDSDFLVFEK
jgi:hypothetical protein